MNAHVTAESRGQALVLTDEDSLDDAQASGRWLKATESMEARQ